MNSSDLKKDDKLNKIRLEDIKFYHPLFETSPINRSLVRIISYSFFIIVIGVIFACLISEIERLRWIGILLTLIVLDFLIHFKKPSYSIASLLRWKVPSNNIAFCADRQTIFNLLEAFEKVESIGGDLELAILFNLTDDLAIIHSLKRLDVPVDEFKQKVDDEFEKSIKNFPKISKDQLIEKIRLILIQAALQAQSHGRPAIDSQSIFLSLAQSQNPLVNKIFDYFSIDPNDIEITLIFGKFAASRFKLPLSSGGFALKLFGVKPHRVNRTFTSRPTPNLDKFSKDLTDLARLGAEGFLIGHQEEYEQLVDILCRSEKRNALLIGDPGVGKDSIVAHLAFEIISDQVPSPLFDRRLVQLSLSDLISGSSAQEIFDRLSLIAKEIVIAGNIILYIPEIHLLFKDFGNGRASPADLFVPILENSTFPVIGSTYFKEYKEFMESQSSFANIFETIQVREITPQQAAILLTYDAIIFERQYGIRINFSAIKRAVDLAVRYFHYKPLPSSARDLLSEAISMATQKNLKELTGYDLEMIAQRKTNIPLHQAGKKEAEILLNLEKIIHTRYINQEEAVTAVAKALRAYRSGLSSKKGPIATFLFVGPTGVGKTELSKIIADLQFGSEKYMVRFDMSEYQQKESISRFIGSPDGKIAGSLTEAIIQRPYSLILLDEFEKAHPDILNLFLQVFDEGRLTDSLGRVVDFQNTIIIATSNAHSVYIQEQIASGKSISDFSDQLKKKLFDYFKPELINRFSEIVVFKPLSLEDLVAVAKMNLNSLSQTLMENQAIELIFDDQVVKKIAQIGYDPTFGARPLKRAIDDHIKSVLAEKILSGQFVRGHKVLVSLDDNGKFQFTVSS